MRNDDYLLSISLGAGVQSSVMALMATYGELEPTPHVAIFADTQSEPLEVYHWLDWLAPKLSFPIIRATAGNLGIDSTLVRTSKTGKQYVAPSMPVFTKHKGRVGMLSRQCTSNYKINVVKREIRKLMRRYNLKHCVQWIGITTDEATRMKDSQVRYIRNEYPLVSADFSREDCLNWMEEKEYPRPPRSACIFCPYKSDNEWTSMTQTEFQEAIAYEERLNTALGQTMTGKFFLHRSCKPLDQVQFKQEGQEGEGQRMFGNECEGMCGV